MGGAFINGISVSPADYSVFVHQLEQLPYVDQDYLKKAAGDHNLSPDDLFVLLSDDLDAGVSLEELLIQGVKPWDSFAAKLFNYKILIEPTLKQPQSKSEWLDLLKQKSAFASLVPEGTDYQEDFWQAAITQNPYVYNSMPDSWQTNVKLARLAVQKMDEDSFGIALPGKFHRDPKFMAEVASHST